MAAPGGRRLEGAPGRVDLNADLGEWPEPSPGDPPGTDAETDRRLLSVVTTAHVACGVHAGGPEVMRRTVAAAAAAGVAVGAHPSYPDPFGFGRRPMGLSPEEVADVVVRQVDALAAVARAAGVTVVSVKPHGALYHRLATDTGCAVAVAAAVRDHGGGTVLVLPAGAGTRPAVEAAGVAVVAEGFCDRAYLADGTLAPRGVAWAVVEDPAEAARRAVSLATTGEVAAVDGTVVALRCDTLCVHGDTPGAVAIAAAVRRALAEAGVAVAPFAADRAR